MANTSEEQQGNPRVRKAALKGLLVNLGLVALKGTAGVTTGSRALIADAVHSLSDLTTDIAVVLGARYWSRPPDENHPLGHRGIETAVSIFIGIMLLAAGAGIGIDALVSIGRNKEVTSPGIAAAAAALASLIVKEILSRWTLKMSRITGSVALSANAVHHRSDALSSIPVLIAVSISIVKPELAFLDAVAGAVVSIFVIISGWKILKPGLLEMANTAPPAEVLVRIRDTALSVQGVRGIHALRARMETGGLFVDLHVQLSGEMTLREGFVLCRKVEEAIRTAEPSIRDVIARIEPAVPCGDADRCHLDWS